MVSKHPDAAANPVDRSTPDFRGRVVIEHVKPEVDCGHFPIKRAAGDTVTVTADIFADGHDLIAAVLQYWEHPAAGQCAERHEVPMVQLVNDRWSAQFQVSNAGNYGYTLEAWIDRFGSWRRDVMKKVGAGKAAPVDLLVGAELIGEAGRLAPETDAARLAKSIGELREINLEGDQAGAVERLTRVVDDGLAALMLKYSERRFATTYGRELAVSVDREKARCSAWYEMFPRSASPEPGRHGTFKDCEARLPYVAEMGFDVLYLPPIHPIGETHRKGPNNSPGAGPGDPGSPWAIGSKAGGHKSVHPELGTLEDFRHLVARARENRLEI